MKLFFDENLSPRLTAALSELYPESTSVAAAGLVGGPDREIWRFARRGGFVIVTRDSDFHRLSLMLGPPPKVIWLAIGNSSVATIVQLFRDRYDLIVDFVEDEDAAFLALS